MDAKAFGARVRQARLYLSAKEGRTITQVEVAKELDVTGVTVGRWESGLKEPDLATIERLAKVLEVSPSWLAFGEGFPLHRNGNPPAIRLPEPPREEIDAYNEKIGVRPKKRDPKRGRRSG